jgi:hypothetical protein
MYNRQKIESKTSEFILFSIKKIIDEKALYFSRIQYLIERISRLLENFKDNPDVYMVIQESTMQNPIFTISDTAIDEAKNNIGKLQFLFYTVYEYRKNCEEVDSLLRNFPIIHQTLSSRIQYELYGNFDPLTKELLYVIKKLMAIPDLYYTPTTVGCNIYVSPFMISFYHRDCLDLDNKKILTFLG